MQCVRIEDDRQLHHAEVDPPTVQADTDVRLRMEYCALNRIDLFSLDGMAFAQQDLPVISGAEGCGVVEEVGAAVTGLAPGDRVVVYPGLVCWECERCRAGRENLCENPRGIMGFHVNGLAAEQVVVPARHLIPVPDGVPMEQAAGAPIAIATVEHMLIDNAKLESGETILVQAGGSGIGSVAIPLAKHLGATVITTVGSDAKVEKAKALGADHVINYSDKRVQREVRKITKKRGVDVVFEHVGAATWDGSILSLAKGGRLVICGSHTGSEARLNLIHFFNQQHKLLASFGASVRNVRDSLERLRRGDLALTIDSVYPLADFEQGIDKLRRREVFGKVLYRCQEG